jgi:excinuclease ABC subunit A
MDSGREHLFNSKFACPVCSYSIERAGAAPVLVQLAQGACPACDGLGQQECSTRRAWWPFPSLSLASGAIKGWDRRNGYYFAMLESLAAHYGFDVDTPFEQLPEQVRHVVLHGSGDEDIASSATPGQRRKEGQGPSSRSTPSRASCPTWRGATARPIPAVVREDLARYRSTQPCPDCGGTRLRREARHVLRGRGEAARAPSTR